MPNTSNGIQRALDYSNVLTRQACSKYTKSSVLPLSSNSNVQCVNHIQVEEILNFTQEDLDMDDPFILDCYAEVCNCLII